MRWHRFIAANVVRCGRSRARKIIAQTTDGLPPPAGRLGDELLSSRRVGHEPSSFCRGQRRRSAWRVLRHRFWHRLSRAGRSGGARRCRRRWPGRRRRGERAPSGELMMLRSSSGGQGGRAVRGWGVLRQFLRHALLHPHGPLLRRQVVVDVDALGAHLPTLPLRLPLGPRRPEAHQQRALPRRSGIRRPPQPVGIDHVDARHS